MTRAEDPHEFDSDYDLHGGFPRFQTIEEPPGFGRFVEAMRRAQDLTVAADGADWNAAADLVDDVTALLAPHRAAGGIAPAGRVSSGQRGPSHSLPPVR